MKQYLAMQGSSELYKGQIRSGSSLTSSPKALKPHPVQDQVSRGGDVLISSTVISWNLLFQDPIFTSRIKSRDINYLGVWSLSNILYLQPTSKQP